MKEIIHSDGETEGPDRGHPGAAVVAIIVGAVFALIGISTVLRPVFDGQANSNGVLWGLATGSPILVLGGGLIMLGLGLHHKRAVRPGQATPDGGRSLVRTGAILAIVSVVGIGLVTALLLLFAEGVRQTT